MNGLLRINSKVVVATGFLTAALATNAAPTFTKDVAPILFRNCAKCHGPDGIASKVAILSYDTARPWAKSIKEKVLLREMPPWPADSMRSLRFRNDARLTRHEIDTLVAWSDAGALKGNNGDLPPMPKFEEGWLHPNGLPPDLVISLPGDFQVPAEGDIPYIQVLANVPFLEDQWLAASQTRPGNRAVVHHMAITEVALEDQLTDADPAPLQLLALQLGPPGSLTQIRPAVTDPTNSAVFDMLGVYTPGTTFEMYGDEGAKLLKGGKNLYLNFNIHYQATGKPEKDRSTIGLWFRKSPPKHQLLRVPGAVDGIIVEGKELLTDAPGTKAEGTNVAIPPIPPYVENYEVIGLTAYTEPVTIYQFQPHAHLRGKDFTYSVIFPDGRQVTVLSVPKYAFDWQLAYELETPLKLPPGSKLVVTAHYDNSPKNKYNPAPEKPVYFRAGQNQSWDEMFTPFIQYTRDNQDLTKPPKPPQILPGEETNAVQDSNERNFLPVVGVTGCLAQNPAAEWMLTDAGAPYLSKTQATSAAALRSVGNRPLGDGRYHLLGVSVFNPAAHRGQEVAVKGVLIKNAAENRLNVTSLQTIAATCAR